MVGHFEIIIIYGGRTNTNNSRVSRHLDIIIIETIHNSQSTQILNNKNERTNKRNEKIHIENENMNEI